MRNLTRCILLAVLFASVFGGAARPDALRIAHYSVGLERDGPGLLFRDISKGTDKQIKAVLKIIGSVRPDVLVLNGFDNDADLFALRSFSDQLGAQGLQLPFLFAPQQNAGLDTKLDLNGNGYLADKADAQGFGGFRGQGAMAIMSAHPIDYDGVRDFTEFLWKDLQKPSWPVRTDGSQFYSNEIKQILRLHSAGAWVVPIDTELGTLNIIASHSTPPVFDGAEDANGRRNKDQLRFWTQFLDQEPRNSIVPFVMALGLNADPNDGEGYKPQLLTLLNNKLLADPKPTSRGALLANKASNHKSPHDQNTVDWREPIPGNLRVDYVLASQDLRVQSAGVFWPEPNAFGAKWVADAQTLGTRHKLVWVDVELPQIKQNP